MSSILTDASMRRRLTWTLFGAVALATTGYIAAITVSTLAARDLTGSPRLAGLPAAMSVVGTAVGTALWGQLTKTRGRRFGLVAGYGAAVVGAGVVAFSVSAGTFGGMVAGMAVLGFGQSASHLARYAAADLAVAERRGAAVSVVVWAGTVGAVIGPRLLEPAGQLAEGFTGTTYAGAFLATSVFMAGAGLLLAVALRPDPSSLASLHAVSDESAVPLRSARSALGHPGVQLAIAALVAGQVVMVLIMTATPIHIENTGFGLDLVGVIISAHTLGMFAFSPITGRLTDRFGPIPMIGAGAGMLLLSALMAAAAPPEATTLLGWGLFLLGLGWNFGFVAGSALLTASVTGALRPIVQGRVDALVWLGSAAASFSSGLLLAGPGYRALGAIGTALVALPVVMLALRGRAAMALASA